MNCFAAVHYWLRSVRKLVFMADDRTLRLQGQHQAVPNGGPALRLAHAQGCLRRRAEKGREAPRRRHDQRLVDDRLGGRHEGAREAIPGLPAAGGRHDLHLGLALAAEAHLLQLQGGSLSLGELYLGCCLRQVPNLVPAGEQHPGLMSTLRKSTNDPALMLEAGTATKLCAMLGWLPPCISKKVWPVVTNKVTVSMSNVPGPQFPMKWIGQPVKSMLFFVPPRAQYRCS
eukprot:SRR837773.16744.p1 GENE.SRR837773.16744~~SRR837773.16744.p1  ORF type:complete len:254 (+),score=36.45 SRR837773.16744:77-763(+)